jgi:pyruvate formate-lyase activating enzyme-like uncharacterized protein
MHKAARRITQFEWDGLLAGLLPMGCQQCLNGAKLVIFATGKCKNPLCRSYCPISTERRDKDIVYANERKIGNWNSKSGLETVIKEAENAGSEGASFTGGNPLLVVDHVIEAAKNLKIHFGTTFHLHLYAPVYHLKNRWLDKLCLVIDEIRFHPTSLEELCMLDQAFLKNWDFGIEVPAFPGQERYLIAIAEWLESKALKYEKAPFLNINQLESSESNYRFLLKSGLSHEKDSLVAIAGSSQTASAVVSWVSKNLELTTAHYCPSSAKDSVQFPARLLRYARNMAQPFDIIREEGPHRGLLIRGAIRGKQSLTKHEQERLKAILLEKLEIPEDQIAWDPNKKRFLVNPLILEDCACEIRDFSEEEDLDLLLGIVEEYPTADGLETGYDPL